VHSAEMQIHAVAVDDITLWVNRGTKCHWNTISRSHFIAHYVSGRWIFHRELYYVTPAAFMIRRQQP